MAFNPISLIEEFSIYAKIPKEFKEYQNFS